MPERDIRIARKCLESIDAIELLEDLSEYKRLNVWIFKIRATVRSHNTELVPDSTDWYVLVSNSYPLGSIDIYPSKENSITDTFEHQDLNSPTQYHPWRCGKPCLITDSNIFGDRYDIGEPKHTEKRLEWHLLRLLKWLQKASEGKLIEPNERFETPVFKSGSDPKERIVFTEDNKNLAFWENQTFSYGLTTFSRSKISPYLFSNTFMDLNKSQVLQHTWGKAIQQSFFEDYLGLWLIIPSPPILKAWSVPQKWSELKSYLESLPFDHQTFFKKSLETLRREKVSKPLIFIGFPIPEFKNGVPKEIFWQSTVFPDLTDRNKMPKKRKKERYLLENDLKNLSQETQIPWIKSENWSPANIIARGACKLSKHKITVIGAGSLGAEIADCLNRGGCNELTIIDSDTLQAGNLSRHILKIDDVGFSKTEALENSLNRSNPHSHTKGIQKSLESAYKENAEIISKSSLIIDTTGSDEVLRFLAELNEDFDAALYSFSIGFQSENLYFYKSSLKHLNPEAFWTFIRPFIDQDLELMKIFDLPTEGVGCWHKLFPLSYGDVKFAASCAINYMEQSESSTQEAEIVVASISKTPFHNIKITRQQVD